MGDFAETLVRGGRFSLRMADMLLADIRAETFARQPSFSERIIHTNHPAFVYGHLATYPAGWLTVAGLNATPGAAPANYAELFAAGKECRDDPDGTIYPPMDEIVATFRRVHAGALDALPALSDDQLRGPNPREGRIREMFPTLGGLMMFYMTSHMMLHLGQVSTWRRCFGLGSAMK